MPKVTICIDVSDLESATAFYCEGLGCSLEKTRPTHNTLSADGTTIHLALREEGSSPLPTGDDRRRYTRHWTPVHLDFDVEDVDVAVREVEQRGGSVEGVKRGSWGAAAFCADPFGNGFCLLAVRESS